MLNVSRFPQWQDVLAWQSSSVVCAVHAAFPLHVRGVCVNHTMPPESSSTPNMSTPSSSL